MKKYVIITGLDTLEVEEKVCAHIEKGYEPCGGIYISDHLMVLEF